MADAEEKAKAEKLAAAKKRVRILGNEFSKLNTAPLMDENADSLWMIG